MDTATLQAAIDAGKNLTQSHRHEGYKPVVTAPHLPNSLLLMPEKLEHPRFLTASPTFHDTSAFVAYLVAFKTLDSRIFYTQEGAFTAVIDYHYSREGLPMHGDHTACLVLKRSPEWETWRANSEESMGQQAFAEFLEDNSRDLLEPGPEAMMEVATGLHATTGATFRRAINQANGQVQFQYDENIEAKVAGGTKEVPTTFQVALRPFMGNARYPVDCRLRYRVAGGALAFHYKALHLDPITEAAIDGIVAKITDETGIAPALGNHDAAAFAKGT